MKSSPIFRHIASIDFVELLKLEFHLISLSLYTNVSKRDIESPGSAHVSTTYVRIYRIGALCYRKHASTYIRMALETIDTIVTCAISETAILDTPSKAPPPPRAFEDVIRSIQIADCGNVATHYVKFNDSRPGPPRATRSQTSPSLSIPSAPNLFSLATPFCNIYIQITI